MNYLQNYIKSGSSCCEVDFAVFNATVSLSFSSQLLALVAGQSNSVPSLNNAESNSVNAYPFFDPHPRLSLVQPKDAIHA